MILIIIHMNNSSEIYFALMLYGDWKANVIISGLWCIDFRYYPQRMAPLSARSYKRHQIFMTFNKFSFFAVILDRYPFCCQHSLQRSRSILPFLSSSSFEIRFSWKSCCKEPKDNKFSFFLCMTKLCRWRSRRVNATAEIRLRKMP